MVQPLTSAPLLQQLFVNMGNGLTFLPIELIKHIFSLWNLKELSRMSLVCRTWRQALKSPCLHFEKIASVFRMAVAIPRSDALFLASNLFYFYEILGQTSFFSPFYFQQNLYLLKKTGKKVKCDLNSFKNDLSEIKVKVKKIESTILLSEKQFIITSNNRLFIFGITGDHVSMQKQIEFTNDLNLKQKLKKVCLLGNKLCIFESLLNKTTTVKKYFAFYSLDLKRISEFYFFEESLCRVQNNSKKIFLLLEKSGGGFSLRSYYLDDQNSLNSEEYSMPNEYPLKWSWVQAVCNDKWVIVARYYRTPVKFKQQFRLQKLLQKNFSSQANKRMVVFHIFDATIKLKEKFQFQYDCSHIRSREFTQTNASVQTQTNWLCGDFLIYWLGLELHIWHIVSSRYITSINLEGLITSSFSYGAPSILNVEIHENNIEITVQSWDEKVSNHLVKLIKFELDASIDSSAKKYANSNFQKSTQLFSYKFNYLINTIRIIVDRIIKLLQKIYNRIKKLY